MLGKRKIRTLLTFLAMALMLLGVTHADAAPPAARRFPVEQRVLANGLRVVLAPDPLLDGVSVVVRYGVGSGDEPQGMDGVAHLIEHLLFAGSRHVPSRQTMRILEALGAANRNGTTDPDATVLFETVPSEALERTLWLESDRMGFLFETLTDAQIDTERQVVMNEHRQRVLDTPLGALPIIEAANLFPSWHPYRHETSGTIETLSALRPANVRAFFATWYTPANATLVLVGNFDTFAANALVDRYFGPLASRRPPLRPALPFFELPGDLRVSVGAAVPERVLTIAWLTPSLGAPGDAELDVAATILASAEGGWLRQELVDKRHLATAVDARQASRTRMSVFRVRVTLAEGASTEDALGAIESAIGEFRSRVRVADIEHARQRWRMVNLFALEDGMARALALANRVQRDARLDTFEGASALQSAVSASSVQAAVELYLTKERVITTVYRIKDAPRRGMTLKRELQ